MTLETQAAAAASNPVDDCVTVSIRFVPTGVERSPPPRPGTPAPARVGTLTGTLILSPVAGAQGAGCTHEVRLATWPRDVEALIRQHPITLSLAPVDPALPTAPTAPAVTLTARRANGLMRAEADTALAASLWTRIFGGTDTGGVALLRTALAASDGATVPSQVIATGQGDAGLLLSLERARSVLDRVAETPAAAPPGASFVRPAETLKTRTAARMADRKTQAPWLMAARELRDGRVQEGLAAHRAKVDEQAGARTAYRSATKPDEIKAGLARMERERPSGTAPAVSAKIVATGGDAALEQALDRARLLHYAGTQTEAKPVDKPAAEDTQLALQRFFSVSQQPKLSRLVNLVVDVEVPLDEAAWTALAHLPPSSGGSDRFVFASVRLGDVSDARVVWTTAKLRLPHAGDGSAALFWACTREEMQARAVGYTHEEVVAAGWAGQVDGLVSLGAAQTSGGERHPRFDVLSIDPRRATEADLGADANAAWGQNGGLTTVGTAPDGGLVLVDRWRQFQAASRTADRSAAPSGNAMVIDAEDLTVGLRLDVKLDGGDATRWRSLVERRIKFSDGAIERSVAALVPDAAARASLDAASLAVSTRLRSPGPNAQVTAFTEEIVAQWFGEPLGLDLHAGGTAIHAADWPDKRTNDVRTSLVDIAMEYSLVDRGADRPPRQCYGWAFRVGARAQLEGGLARNLPDAARRYEAGGDGFVLPSPAAATGRRLLRHRRIEAPVVTTPIEILQRVVPGPQETALELVVRSKTGVNGTLERLGPEHTHRVLVPPPVSLDFADRHDVFKTAAEHVETGPNGAVRPKGGLKSVAFDRQSFGTFPIWSRQQDSAGACYPDWPAPKPGTVVPLDRQPYPAPTGDAVFMPIQPGHVPSDRQHPYYPDPAAELMVFRLRHENGDEIDGPSLVVRVRRQGVGYPDVTPIAVQLVRLPAPAPLDQSRLGLDQGPKSAAATGHEAWGRPASPVYLSGSGAIGRTPGPRDVEGARVLVRLAPGERLQLDTWCLPRPETLAALFDVVEGAALLVEAAGGAADCYLPNAAFLQALATMVGRPEAELARMLDRVATLDGSEEPGPCGPGHLSMPCWNHLGLLADLIQTSACDRVMPELAARTTLWVTHAIDKPLQPPGFDLPDVGMDGRDLPGGAAGPGPAFPATLRRMLPEGATPANGAAPVELAGWVTVHRATSRFLEVHARGASLVSGAFDDPRRGRSDDDQARGIWPANGQGPDDGGWRTPGELFGFTVDRDGVVTLPREEVTLLRIDDLAQGSPHGDLLDLGAAEAFLRQARLRATPGPGEANGGEIVVGDERSRPSDGEPPALGWAPIPTSLPDRSHPVRPGTIGDAKARVIELSLVAGSRTAPLIRRDDGAALLTQEQCVRSGLSRRVLLPASKAPARVVPLAIRPAFHIAYDGLSAKRRTRLRVRVRRPWFSSGEGERLGVVLWPPDFAARRDCNETDQIERDTLPGPGEASTVDMSGFSDLDLGPGGEFVTRWGGDPAAGGAGPRSWLMPPSCFVQADFARRRFWSPEQLHADLEEVIYVPRALMPLPATPGETTGEPSAPPTMTVALLAFRPRFDVDLEHFYFDIEIEPGAALQPFVRLGLVRYQANAPDHLRLSEPVVEWAQLLPRRTLAAEIEAKNARFCVSATVSGPGLRGQDAPEPDSPRRTRMIFGLYREDPAGRQSRVAQSITSAGPSTDTWTCPSDALILDEDPGCPAEVGARYFLLVQEHDEMLPATYAEEPFDPSLSDASAEPVQSGPRFAARLDLTPRAANKPKKTTSGPGLATHSG